MYAGTTKAIAASHRPRGVHVRGRDVTGTKRACVLGSTLLVAASGVAAQTLGEENPVSKVVEVVQFGLPDDAKFVFCEGADCPERSAKHLMALPVPAGMPRLPAAPVRIEPATALSHAKDDGAMVVLSQEKLERGQPASHGVSSGLRLPVRKVEP